jgi:hypothetical protein
MAFQALPALHQQVHAIPVLLPQSVHHVLEVFYLFGEGDGTWNFGKPGAFSCGLDTELVTVLGHLLKVGIGALGFGLETALGF